jgi:hypothetical protein
MNALNIALSAKTVTFINAATSLQEIAYITKALRDAGQMTTAVQEALDAKTSALVSTSTSLKDMAYLTKALYDDVVDSNGSVLYPWNQNAPYGWLWNDLTEESYRLGHNVMSVQLQMRRVVCTGNPMFGGTVHGYLNATNSELYEDGTSAAADIRGANNRQVYVETPKFYYKMHKIGALNYYWQGIEPFEGAKCHEMFRKSGWTDSGDGSDVANEHAFGYFSAFEGVLYDASETAYIDGIATAPTLDLVNDKLVSIAGFKPTSTITISQGRTLAANGGSKHFDWHRYSAMRLCFIIEYMSHNSQLKISGYTENTSSPSFVNDALKTGLTTSLGNASGSISGSANHLAAGGDGGFNGVVANSYRGIENFYGHLWNWVDAINYSNGQPFVCQIFDAFASDAFSGVYLRATDTNGVAITQPLLNGYQSKLFSGGFFVQNVGGTSASDVTDYYYYGSGNRVLLCGGSLASGSVAGVGALNATASSSVYWDICSRL